MLKAFLLVIGVITSFMNIEPMLKIAPQIRRGKDDPENSYSSRLDDGNLRASGENAERKYYGEEDRYWRDHREYKGNLKYEVSEAFRYRRVFFFIISPILSMNSTSMKILIKASEVIMKSFTNSETIYL